MVQPSVFPIRSAVTDEQFRRIWETIDQHVSFQRIEYLTRSALDGIEHMASIHRPAAVAYSGGKDSLVIYDLARRLGITTGMIGLTDGLEYPEFETWLAVHKPQDIVEIRQPLHMAWLVEHPEMLFPRNSTLLSRWYRIDWQSAQDQYCHQQHIQLLLLGRRTQDHNYTGPAGQDWYTKKGTVRYSPLKDWTHEEILAYLHYNDLPLSPYYFWYNGFTEASHPWPMRAQTLDDEDAWAQLWSIDPSIVQQAAPHIASAQAFLEHPVPIKSVGPKKSWGKQGEGSV